MRAWKKIAAMLGLSVSTALLGAACTAEVEEPTDLQALAVESADEADVALEEGSADALSETPLAEGLQFNGDRGGRCERSCGREYRQCLQFSNRPRARERCDRQLRRCLRSCNYH